MIRRFFRHIREGFYGVGRHAAMSVSSASAVTITLLIISIFMIVTGNMQEVTHNIEGSVKISAFVAYDHEEQAQLDMIQATIKNLEHVVSVEYSSKDQEFDELMETYEDESAREALETYREDNPLHDAFYVEVNDGDALKDTAEKIQAIEGIETVNYGGDSALMFVQALNSVRFGGGDSGGGLKRAGDFPHREHDQADDLRTKQRDCDHAGCGRDERFYPGAVCGGRNDYRSAGRDHSDLVYDLWLYLYL